MEVFAVMTIGWRESLKARDLEFTHTSTYVVAPGDTARDVYDQCYADTTTAARVDHDATPVSNGGFVVRHFSLHPQDLAVTP
jgi:hypothetical protein